MGVRTLSEAIILQSLEDLSDTKHRVDSLAFFSGEGFRICSEMAGLDVDSEARLLKLAGQINALQKGKTAGKGTFRGRRLPSAAPLHH
jgi:hypothetical protein